MILWFYDFICPTHFILTVYTGKFVSASPLSSSPPDSCLDLRSVSPAQAQHCSGTSGWCLPHTPYSFPWVGSRARDCRAACTAVKPERHQTPPPHAPVYKGEHVPSQNHTLASISFPQAARSQITTSGRETHSGSVLVPSSCRDQGKRFCNPTAKLYIYATDMCSSHLLVMKKHRVPK